MQFEQDSARPVPRSSTLEGRLSFQSSPSPGLQIGADGVALSYMGFSRAPPTLLVTDDGYFPGAITKLKKWNSACLSPGSRIILWVKLSKSLTLRTKNKSLLLNGRNVQASWSPAFKLPQYALWPHIIDILSTCKYACPLDSP